MKKQFLLFLFINILIFQNIFAQQKYAILLTGPYTNDSTLNLPDSGKWNSGISSDNPIGWDEFWNDTYLMWEMLVYEKGFTNENVFVLFADGVDLHLVATNKVANRYNPTIMHNINFITDASATKTNVFNLIEGFKTGKNNVPRLTKKDTLYVCVTGNTYNNKNNIYIKLKGERGTEDLDIKELEKAMNTINVGKIDLIKNLK